MDAASVYRNTGSRLHCYTSTRVHCYTMSKQSPELAPTTLHVEKFKKGDVVNAKQISDRKTKAGKRMLERMPKAPTSGCSD